MGKFHFSPQQSLNNTCDWFFNYFKIGAHEKEAAVNFQLFLCFLNIAMSAYPIICYVLYSQDIHIVFWLGEVPSMVNLGVPITLCLLNLGVNFFQAADYFGCKMRPEQAKFGCNVLFNLLGTIQMGMGFYVWMLAEQRATELIENCGEDPMTRKLEDQWQKLNAFYEDCDVKRNKALTQCPGFTDEFPNRVFVNYLESLELDFACVGFCKFWAKPIFDSELEPGLRCATALGRHVQQIAGTVGFPTACCGGLLNVVGIMLAFYDHL